MPLTEEASTGSGSRPAADAGSAVDVFDVATSHEGCRIQTPDDIDGWRRSRRPDFVPDPLHELQRSDPQTAHRVAQAVTAMPAAGSEFLGFRLLGELGRGAFARVYLAQQGDLAGRFVVLKVSPDVGGESQALAQLQHTNVVPIYSLHRAGPLQAVCMPYLGATTLVSVLKEIQGREALPASGKGLVSTLVDRKSTTRDGVPLPSWWQPPSAPPVPAPPGAPEQAAEAPAKQVIGSTVILDKLLKLSYVDAVVWTGARLADGLAHAHEHGILHRDLKPANILLTDEGQPMLLDFNLACDTKLRFNACAAMVGGTLPYMSPEQLTAYRAGGSVTNSNSDVYALGVIFYELLTGRHPFAVHTGPAQEILARMVEDRLQPPPVRRWNKAVTPAIESVVRHCLEPDPARRYQSARELQEDLERQLDNLPLQYAPEPSVWERAQKWVRRHPRLTSTTTMGVFAAGLVLALVVSLTVRGSRLARLEAEKFKDQFLKDKDPAVLILAARTNDAEQLGRGMRLGHDLLARYGVLDNPTWQESAAVRNLSTDDRQTLRANVGEVLIYLARAAAIQAQGLPDGDARNDELRSALRLNECADHCFDPDQSPKALWMQRSQLAERLGRKEQAADWSAKADRLPIRSATDYFLVSAKYVAEGQLFQAIPLLEEATQKHPQNFWNWLMLGVCYDGLLRYADAAACYTTAIAIWPDFAWTYYHRGLAHFRQQHHRQSLRDFDEAVGLKADLAEAYPYRALAKLYLHDFAGAEADCARALAHGAPSTQVYLIRSRVRRAAGDKEAAARDQQAGLDSLPHDELGWLTRGDLLNRLGHKKEALHDFDEALKCNPRSLFALQNKSNVLSTLGQNEAALEVSSRLVSLYPDFIDGRTGRGTLHARLGHLDAAYRDAKECFQRDQSARVLFQLAGIYAQTSKTRPADRQVALERLSAALYKGFGYDYIETDKDLDPIRDTAEFRRLLEAARELRPKVTLSSAKR